MTDTEPCIAPPEPEDEPPTPGLPPLPRSVRAQVPILAELCAELAELGGLLAGRLRELRLRHMPERLGDQAFRRPKQDEDAEDEQPEWLAVVYHQQAALARRRASSPRYADRQLELIAKAERLERRASALDRGEAIPVDVRTPSEHFEALLREHARTALALAAFLELDAGEPCPEP